MYRMYRRTGALLALVALAGLSGCGALLPHGEERVVSAWDSFDAVMGDYEQVQPGRTSRSELVELGFSPERSPNVQILNHFEILNRVAPHQAVAREDLPAGLLRCLQAQESCQAYEVKILATEHKRYGNFLADFFNFRRKTQVHGWSFNAVFVLDDGLVIYKVWNGTPQIEEYSDINNPLGPLQGIGSNAVKPSISY